ncbi:MAG: hypothetical protein AAGA62_13725, partial [Bacteroidota bacterium]
GSAQLVVDSSDVNLQGTFTATTGTLSLTGDKDVNLTSGGNRVVRLEVRKTPGTKVSLQDDLLVEENLDFTAAQNYVWLASNDLSIGTAGTISGYSSTNFLVTNGTGFLRKIDLGAVPFEYPIGFNQNTYNPAILFDDLIVDDYGVRCLATVLQDGGSGAPISNGVVDASWEVDGGQVGEMSLNLTVQWNVGDELPGFDRSKCGIAQYGPIGWDLPLNFVAPAGGSNPYQRERVLLSEPGFFAVGNEVLTNAAEVDINVYLQGPYSGVGFQNDDLRAAGLLPLQEPYSALGFTQAGFGGGQSVDPAVFDAVGNDAIIDWILLEFYAAATPGQLLTTVPVLLQR